MKKRIDWKRIGICLLLLWLIAPVLLLSIAFSPDGFIREVKQIPGTAKNFFYH